MSYESLSRLAWAPAQLVSSPEDPLDLGRRRPSRRVVGSRAPIDQTGDALGLEAADPLVSGRSADALGLGRHGHRPALHKDPGHQQLAAEAIELGPRMSHESLLRGSSSNNPNPAGRLSFVNNVREDDN